MNSQQFLNSWGEIYNRQEHKVSLAALVEEFYNQCHSPKTGIFCEGKDGPGRQRDNERKKEKSGFHPAGDYAYTPDKVSSSTWKLRLTSKPGGKPDAKTTAAAAQALSPAGFRGNRVQIPAKKLPAVITKVRQAWLEARPDATEADLPEILKKN